jgi:hypothetical protein
MGMVWFQPTTLLGRVVTFDECFVNHLSDLRVNTPKPTVQEGLYIREQLLLAPKFRRSSGSSTTMMYHYQNEGSFQAPLIVRPNLYEDCETLEELSRMLQHNAI